MAWDYLPIQGSATPSEHAFSNVSLTDSKQHNRLTIEVFEALQNLKSMYRNGHMSATAEALRHYKEDTRYMGSLDSDAADTDL